MLLPVTWILLTITTWLAAASPALPAATTVRQPGQCPSAAQITNIPAAVPELFRRQRTTSTLATCGYVTGDANRPVTCNAGYACASSSTYMGCCSESACGILTTCVPYSAACNSACSNDFYLLRCSAAAPYCGVFNYGGSATAVLCTTTPGYSLYVLDSATNGGATVATPSSVATPSTSSTASSTTSSSSIVQPSAPSTSPASSSETASASSGGSSGLSGGAIAGIVIGVVLGVALVGGLAWFIGRKSRKNKAAAAASHNAGTGAAAGGAVAGGAAVGGGAAAYNASHEAKVHPPPNDTGNQTYRPYSPNAGATGYTPYSPNGGAATNPPYSPTMSQASHYPPTYEAPSDYGSSVHNHQQMGQISELPANIAQTGGGRY